MADSSDGDQSDSDAEENDQSDSDVPPATGHHSSTSAGHSSQFICPRCRKAFKSRTWWTKHVDSHPPTCIQRQLRIARRLPDTVSAAVQPEDTGPLHLLLARHKKETFIPDHIPQATRRQVANSLSQTLRQVSERNDVPTWSKLLLFTYSVLGSLKSSRSDRTESLPKQIRRNLNSPFRLLRPSSDHAEPHVVQRCTNDILVKNIGRKLQDGDISGAVRVLISDETVLPFDVSTIEALKGKHPEGKPVILPVVGERQTIPRVTAQEVQDAIRGFPNGSAGGPDGMRPQHMKELLRCLRGVDLDNFCELLAKVADVMLEGNVPEEIRTILYGANLFAFRKKDGGVRPIAVGFTLRRIVSRIVSRRCQPQGSRFQPQQLGFATPGGAEAGVHAARFFVEQNLTSATPKVLVKLDVKNAFNSLDRTTLLDAVALQIPAYLPYVQQMYGAQTHLLAGSEVLASSRGVQQGDPFGPLGYCLGTEDSHRGLQSQLTESYLDDDILGGEPEDVLADFQYLVERSRSVGLELNFEKCELFVLGGSRIAELNIKKRAREMFEGLLTPPMDKLSYLGSPLIVEATPPAIEHPIERLKFFSSRLQLLPIHPALFLLSNSLGPCRMTYLLRTSRAFDFRGILTKYDNLMKDTFSLLINVDMDPSRHIQMSLPLSRAGFGIRSTAGLALSAFLASAHSVHHLTSEISGLVLEEYLSGLETQWQELSKSDIPFGKLKSVQKAWDIPVVDASFDSLLAMAPDEPTTKARLKAACSGEASAWLRAFPNFSTGTRLDDAATRIASALRLGAPVSRPHTCICGAQADALGHHALNCGWSKGRLSTHTALNALLAKSLGSIDFNTELEPVGLSDIDGRRPDGITLAPWLRGKFLAWDITVVNSYAISWIGKTTATAGGGAIEAEKDKIQFYEGTLGEYAFEPLGFETTGTWGTRAVAVLQKIGDALRRKTGEPRSMDYLRQRFSIEIMRGNAYRVLGTASPSDNIDEIFSVIRQTRKFCMVN